VFSYFFLDTLKNNIKPYLIPSEIYTKIKAGVVENANQVPEFGSLKDTGGQQGGEYVFFKRGVDWGSKKGDLSKRLSELKQREEARKKEKAKAARKEDEARAQIKALEEKNSSS